MTSQILPKEVLKYFPYPNVRPYQDEFINKVYSAVKDRRSILVEGSNGLGKTVSALSAVLPIAMEKKLKILYVARTHRQHERVIQELKAIGRRQPVAGLSVRGRNEMCLYRFSSNKRYDAKSLMEVCELLKAKGKCPFYRQTEEQNYHFMQLKEALTLRSYTASEVMHVCKKRNLCPYELVKSALSDVDVVALSYLYVFDSGIRTVFLKNMDIPMQKIILIVDEAHNLPETAVEISGCSLTLFMMHQAELEAQRFGHKDAEDFAKLLYEATEQHAELVRKEEQIPTEFLNTVNDKAGISTPINFYEHLGEIGTQIKKTLLSEDKQPRSYISSMSEFLLRWIETAKDEAYIKVLSKYFTSEENQTAKLEIVALDPSRVTEPVFSSTYANVIMSGTLQPLDAFAKITKLPENTDEHIAPSPFPRENILPIVCCGVTTAMESRTPAMYKTFVERIKEVVQNTPVNTGIFSASYEISRNLLSGGLQEELDKPLFYERRGMTSKANEKLVEEFKDQSLKGGAVYLGVQGGRTSEGVDFPGNQMNSVIIVGVPYAEPTPRVKAQINYYENQFPTHGRDYGYLLPAMKKASQCAGRPVRTLEDKGAIIFLDYRFASRYCRRFLPAWVLRDLKVLPDKEGVLTQEISAFFKR